MLSLIFLRVILIIQNSIRSLFNQSFSHFLMAIRVFVHPRSKVLEMCSTLSTENPSVFLIFLPSDDFQIASGILSSLRLFMLRPAFFPRSFADCFRLCSFSYILFYIFFFPLSHVPYSVQKGKCEYRKPVNRTLSRTVYKKIGFNAANPYLAVGTYVQVKYNDDKIIVKVTDQPMNSNDVLLNLSEESARELGIEDEGLYECTTQVPVWENCFFLRNIWYFGPIISLIGFVALNLSPA